MSSSSKSFVFFYCFIQTYLLCSELVNGCLVAERMALLQFRNSLNDPKNHLLSWRGRECCSWRGIRCDNQTGLVTFINLRNPYLEDSHGLWNLSGKIDSSLLQLKSLEHLDLSCNTFEGIPIPRFFGSLEKLRYLNLSYAGFSGTVPAQLGNLSRLQYLDLSFNFPRLVVDDFHWVSTLSSLKFLPMNYIDLSMVELGLFQALNKLSSLRELHLSSCQVAGIVQRLPFINLTTLQVMDLSDNRFNTMIPSWFANLSSLVHLDLNSAAFYGPISEIWRISSLQYLDLSSYLSPLVVDDFHWVSVLSSLKFLSMNYINLSKVEPGLFQELNKLSSLRELHMSSCGVAGTVQNLPFINLTSLQVIDLSGNNFNTMIPSWFANLSSLVHLDLSNAAFYGLIPEISRISSLKYIDLSWNHNLMADISEILSGNWRQIKNIDISANRVHGFLPDSIGNLTSLVELDLSFNNIEGGIPGSMGKICNLEYLILYSNNLTQALPKSLEVQGCLSDKPLQNLYHFDMSGNRVGGILPEWLGELQNLNFLYFYNNMITGHIPPSLGNLSYLTDLSLNGNQLNGTLPLTLGHLSKLQFFDVSFNQLIGTVNEEHFLKLTMLNLLYMSSNSLIVKFSSMWDPPFQIKDLQMNSCQLGPQFPTWIKTQRELQSLDISNNSILGKIPNWFWDLSSNLRHLNISFNKFEGQIPKPMKFADSSNVDLRNNLFSGSITMPSSQVVLLDLSNNNFSGTIPSNFGQLQLSMIHLSLSYNRLSGAIPASIGNLQKLQIINLSNNYLIGSIPSSLQNCSLLEALVLEHNNLSGQIPYSLGRLVQLQTLHLSNNGLSGLIPQSLQNCTKLETLDLGNNNLSGSIPAWLGERLPMLRILRLRSNKFTGQIPSQLSNLKSLQVLDLANNLLFGMIPQSFGALKAMNTSSKENTYRLYGNYGGTYYEESISIYVNNEQLIYTKTLSLVTSIDLSGNKLTGEFPQTLIKLSGLLILDLSKNNLVGKIPQNINGMKELESLDLSNNHFFGEIPNTMPSLTFLRNLNLSNNNFSGVIPEGGQMTTFSPSAFSGNEFLCGLPLAMVCKENNPNVNHTSNHNNADDNNQELVDDYFFLGVGMGFSVGLLGLVVVIFIKKSWSDAYFEFINWLVENIVNVKKFIPRKLIRLS